MFLQSESKLLQALTKTTTQCSRLPGLFMTCRKKEPMIRLTVYLIDREAALGWILSTHAELLV